MLVLYNIYHKLLTNKIDCKFIIKVEKTPNYLISIKCINLTGQEDNENKYKII